MKQRQSEKVTYCLIPSIQHSKKDVNCEDSKKIKNLGREDRMNKQRIEDFLGQ